MTFLNTPPVNCLGFDIGKHSLVASNGKSLANRRPSIRAFLKTARPDFVVCEPTGGYERLLLDECLRAGIACHRADTAKLKSFIRSFGTLGKSDAIDAAQMATYGRERWKILPLWQKPDPQEEELRCLVRRRADLVAIKVAEQNRSKAPGARHLAASFRAVLACLQRQIEAVDILIAATIARSRTLERRAAICTAMNGIGKGTAASLIALMPELGSMNRHQAASLGGLAPHPNESGTFKGQRRIRGGRPEVRTILFMPALRAAAGKGELAPFYKRLIANGKKPMTAIAAVMRKIIVTLNARLRDDMIPQS